jgi:hypothetical protein
MGFLFEEAGGVFVSIGYLCGGNDTPVGQNPAVKQLTILYSPSMKMAISLRKTGLPAGRRAYNWDKRRRRP